MLDVLITASLLGVAAIHLVPILGVRGGDSLARLYGIAADGPDLAILLRHRAVLFGILGTFFAYAAFVPAMQPVCFVAAAVSLGSFFWLAAAHRDHGPAIRRIVLGDAVAAVCLAVAVAAYLVRGAA